MNSVRWGRAQGPTEPLAAGSLATCSLLPRFHAQTSRRWSGSRWMYSANTSTRTGGCSIISAQASPPTSGFVAICTPAWRGAARTTRLPIPDRVKNEDSHEGQEMHALPSLPLPDPVKNEGSHEGKEMHTLPQKDMLTLDSLMGEPHIRRASSRRTSSTDFGEQKLSDFSVEIFRELLSENNFLGQKIRSILSNQVIS